MGSNKVFEFIVGQSDYITVDMLNALDKTANDQAVASAAWVVEDEMVATLVASSEAVDETGRYVSAKFTAVGEGLTRILLTATAANPTATLVEYVLLQVYIPPISS